MVGENGGELSDVSQKSLESSRGEAIKCVVVGGKAGDGARAGECARELGYGDCGDKSGVLRDEGEALDKVEGGELNGGADERLLSTCLSGFEHSSEAGAHLRLTGDEDPVNNVVDAICSVGVWEGDSGELVEGDVNLAPGALVHLHVNLVVLVQGRHLSLS